METLQQAQKRVIANCVVGFNYQIKNADGKLLDTNVGLAPVCYLHGCGNIIPGLEKALVDRWCGEKLNISISPEDGYGYRNEHLVKTISRAELPQDMVFEIGMICESQMTDGSNEQLVVVDLDDRFIKFDANHPLAGQELFYEIEIVTVRSATGAELQAGAPMDVIDCGPGCRC